MKRMSIGIMVVAVASLFAATSSFAATGTGDDVERKRRLGTGDSVQSDV